MSWTVAQHLLFRDKALPALEVFSPAGIKGVQMNNVENSCPCKE